MSNELEARTKAALKQFDNNMAGIFDRKSFYEGDAYNGEAGKPKLNAGQICFKYVLLIINVIFFIFGAVLMGTGSYALNNHVAILAGQTVPMGLIVLGVFIMLLAILGALSAWRESRAFLGLYFAFLLLFTIILFAVGIAVYVKRNDSASFLTTAWLNAGNDVRQSLQNVMICCGLVVWNDGYNTSYTANMCPAGSDTPLNGVPCLPIMVSTFNSAFTTAGACGIAFSIIMLAGLLFVCYLMSGIKRKREEQDIAQLRSGGEVLGTMEDEPQETYMEEGEQA